MSTFSHGEDWFTCAGTGLTREETGIMRDNLVFHRSRAGYTHRIFGFPAGKKSINVKSDYSFI
ncbi:hypothetical protein D7Z54_24310 [Salibacterium salarium]|uniref:Uncharacterized protein n=1 Tax=Salibacterium salarium TaxID=284579 RepID=A0A3R9P5G1_9BACI|nr:hypothetical protein D7Z54_24310 [Salibacterium salarium]